MPVEVGLREDCVALVALLVLIAVLALLDEVLVERLDLNDLLALPASREHRALFPVVDIDRVFGEVGVILSAEIAIMLIVDWLLLFLAHFIVFKRLFLTYIVASYEWLLLLVELLHLIFILVLNLGSGSRCSLFWFCWSLTVASCCSLCSTWVDISLNDRFFRLLHLDWGLEISSACLS